MTTSPSKPFFIKLSDLDFIRDQVAFPTIHAMGYDSQGRVIYGFTDSNGVDHMLGLMGSFDPLSVIDPVTGLPIYSSARVADGLRDTSGAYNNLTQGWEGFGTVERPFMREMTRPDYSHYLQENSANSAYTNYQAAHGNPANPTDNGAQYSNPQQTVIDYTPRMISQTVVNSGFVDNNPLNGYANPAFAAALQAQSDASEGIGDPQTFIRSINSVAGDPGYSMWFVLFGQFFDHGLDFVAKPGANPAKIIIPLSPDDPLYGTIGPDGQPVTTMTVTRAVVENQSDAGADGKFGTVDDVGHTNGPDGIAGNEDDVYAVAKYKNHTSPFIDQSQTYGSDEQVTTLLREWVADPNNPGQFIAGAALFDGHTLGPDATWHLPDGLETNQTLPTLDELRQHMRDTGRDDLSWSDISNYRARDGQGHVLDVDPGTGGVQVALTGHSILLDMNPHFDNAHITSAKMNTALAADYTNHTYNVVGATTDSLHVFAVTYAVDGGTPVVEYLTDVFNFATNEFLPGLTDVQKAVWGEVLLESVGDHYIAGDGRVNENFGLTSIHHVFHEDHNVQLLNMEGQLLRQHDAQQHDSDASNDGYGQQWQIAVSGNSPVNPHVTVQGGHYVASDGVIAIDASNHFFVAGAGDTLGAGERFLYAADGNTQIQAEGNYTDANGHISWNNYQLFEGVKLIVEMEYQHVAIDQYARLITPDLPEFVTYDSALDSTISLEYSEAAFRFGHSQLRDTIDALEKDASGAYDLTGAITQYGLAQAFLTPGQFADVGPTALALGLSREVGNETDEFVTPALQQSLLGQPLDLPAINISRGRDLGLPTLNEARQQIHDALIAERAADPSTPHHTSIIVDALTPYTSWNDFANNMIHPESLVTFIAAYSFDGDIEHAQAILDADLSGVDQTWSGGTVTVAEAGNFLVGAKDTNGDFLEAGAGGFNNIDLWLGGLAEKHVYGGFLGPTFNAIFEDQMERLMDGDRFYYLYRLDLALPVTTELNQQIVTEQFKDIIERTTDAQHLNGDVMGYADSYVELSYNASDGGAGDAFKTEHKYGYNMADYAASHSGTHIGIYSTGGPGGTAANGSIVNLTNADTGITHAYIRDYRPDIGVNPDGTAAAGYNAHEVIAGTDYNDWIDAGDGDDTIYGGKGDDVLDGKAGAEHIYGEEGNDVIYGGDIDDFLDGGAGDDIIYAGSAAGATDVVIGGAGNDKLYGEAGIDEIHGDDGDDYIDAGGDTDLAFGDGGNDEMYGGDGPDELRGGSGDDIVSGGSGPDLLKGESGDDIIMSGIGGGAAQGDGDEALGDVGFDVVSFSDSPLVLNVAADLNNQLLTAPPGSNIHYEPFDMLMTDIEGLVGSKFADTLLGDVNGNWLIGGSNSDTLRGNGGNDIIIGDSIRLDTLDGAWHKSYDVAGNDVLNKDSAGFLDTQGQDTHFTNLLTSRPNWTFGTDGGSVGSADKAVFTGNRGDYYVKQLFYDTVTHTVVASANANTVTFLKIQGMIGAGLADGTDYVTGVESFQFADVTQNLSQVIINPPADIQWNGNTPSDTALPLNNAAIATLSTVDFDGTSWTYSLLSGPGFSVSAGGTVTKTGGAMAQNTNYTLTIRSTNNLGGVRDETFTISTANINGNTMNLSGTPNDVIAYGLGGADNIIGGNFNDTLFGQGGGDTLNGGLGKDRMVGGGGNDTYVVDNVDDTAVESSGGGTDLIQTTLTTFSLAAIANVENLSFTGVGAFTGTGNNLNNVITGGAGADTLTGGAGNDTLNGGTGNDIAVYTGALSDYSFSLSGTSVVMTDTRGGSPDGADTLNNINLLQFGATVMNLVAGTGANNTLVGTAAADVMLGFGGSDVMTGGGGDDYLNGGTATGTTDRAVYSGSVWDYGFSQSGSNLIVTDMRGGSPDGTDTLANMEAIQFGASTYTLRIGDANPNAPAGGSGADLMLGLGGNDILNGSGGNDVMIGGADNDSFVYATTAAANGDTIIDFTPGVDEVNVSAIDANSVTGGNNAFTFIDNSGSAAATPGFTGLGQLIYYLDSADNHYKLAANTTGSNAAEFTIDLGTTHQTYAASDFIL